MGHRSDVEKLDITHERHAVNPCYSYAVYLYSLGTYTIKGNRSFLNSSLSLLHLAK